MSLPVPTPAALAISEQLTRLIANEIVEHGWISFARYMELALYAPGLGYYSAGAAKFGASGDFVTAPEISPLFGRSLAHQVMQVLTLSGGDVLETGAGSGRLACDLLAELVRLDCLPQRYYILEVSADLRERQQQLIARELPEWTDRVVWLEQLPTAFTGCIVGNEVLDAMPVHVLHWHAGDITERGVAWENQRFVWRDKALASGHLRELAAAISVADDYVSEINLAAQGFISSLAQCLTKGAIIMIDYGFGESEYYHPQRNQGTIMCHYRQHAHDDPFYLTGLQDITAHVDFTAMAVAGIDAGLSLAGYTSQAQFLINCGITDLLAQTTAEDTARYIPQVTAAQKLMSPAEMGELFKVIAWTRQLDAPLLGFGQGDQRRRL
ncbi:class I SAM-dependent methyltransferase [Sulfuriferula thiophila]|uniref:class I SAM-dependent methyltransferase n=1 Tax=Sulfuriferula thiophila TaxID=1781211 RepID=UPI000F606C0B|nr:SAM-dependent methyltransferase [Sulfuriferula thiophila]